MAPSRLISRTRFAPSILAACAVVLTLGLLAPSPAGAVTTFILNGRGWGHGIGLSQYGAKGFADDGRDYGWILAHYFQRTTLGTRVSPPVKVDLDASKAARSSWRIQSGNATTLTVTSLSVPATSCAIAPAATVWITFSASGAVLKADSYNATTRVHAPGAVIRSFSGQVIASTGPQSDSMVRIVTPSGPFAESSVVWRGVVRFTPATSTTGHAIDYVDMEDYLRGVVPRESPSSWPLEALKAQAVAARSYAYSSAASGSVLYCSTMSQVYNGAGDGSGSHESARTDTAVSSTAGQVVVYGSDVVKTYFSSSSGGRTANSKDVWFTSAADNVSPVYYTSVSDADTESPNFRWPTTYPTGSTIASAIRARYSAASVASPATVTKVTTQPGTSGYVRYVTLTWSTGKTATLTGPQFQSALGLKSSAFTITIKNPPPTPTRYEQTDARLVWSGAWSTWKGSSVSGGSYRFSSSAGASLTACFKGTSVSWIGSRGRSFGFADVYLDGVKQTRLDLYASSTVHKAALWTKAGLSSDTTHTLVVRVAGAHRSGATGSAVAVDAIDVMGSLVQAPVPPTWRRVEQTTAALVRSGPWASYTSSLLSGGSYLRTSASAVATFTFSGSRVKWIGCVGTYFGKARATIDGTRTVTIDLYATSTSYKRVLWDSGQLSSGTHTLVIRALHQKRAVARDFRVGIDAFDVLAP